MVQITDHIAKGSFTGVEAAQSSTWRELKGTFYVLSSYLKQQHVKISGPTLCLKI